MKRSITVLIGVALSVAPAAAQDDAPRRLTIGGYGETALTRNFYSDNVYRYSSAAAHQGEQHGRFDVPHAVIYLGYDFGKGWSMQTEIEFEHGGAGSAVEKEFEEAGEWETETEKGGEVALEQFWIQKSVCPEFNIRMGHIIVPVGALNNAHEPLNYFTVYRPEGEYTFLPPIDEPVRQSLSQLRAGNDGGPVLRLHGMAPRPFLPEHRRLGPPA